MDFTSLLSLAKKNVDSSKQKSAPRPEFSAPKKEKREKPRSEVVQKLIDEKKRAKEQERRKQQEEKQNKFVIPRKSEDMPGKINMADLMRDLSSDEDNDADKKDSSKPRSNDSKHKQSDKYSSSKDGHSHRSSSSSKHKSDNDHTKHSQNHESSHRSHSREKEKDRHSSKGHSSSSHSDKHKHSSSNSHKSSTDSNHRDRHSGSSSSKSHSTSSASHKSSRDHKKDSSSSSSDKKTSSASRDGSKKSAKSLSLDELRAEVRKMKEMEREIEGDDQKKDGLPNAVPLEQTKSRQGVELDEVEAKKAKILARTQAILARTKAMLAKDKESEKTPRQRGKKGSSGNTHKDGSDKQIKSKSFIKDSDSDSDEEDGPHELDMSFNGNLQMSESGDILKDIKKKIDDKLGNYNFPDRPVKEKSSRPRSSRLSEKSVRLKKSISSSESRRDKEIRKHMMRKQDKMKALMRHDYQTSFGDSKPKVKKPVFIRRQQQQQPPPMNFEDLLKLAEKKCQEKEPEPIIPKPIKKKVEERPLTKEELDRRQREKESRMRKKHEEELARKGKLPDNRQNESKKSHDDPRSQKSKSESSLLKGALTKPIDRPMGKPQSGKKPGSRYDEENESVLMCGPSSSKPSRPAAPVEASNPWDRIYGQIQKNNPKQEKRKRPVIESSDEEESDYDMDDDFIDDGDGVEDVSAHIRNIFGYDKRKYRHIDEDDDDMEANFATIMKEEARSARLGKMEDLEDIRREEEELKMKKMAKMKKMKHR